MDSKKILEDIQKRYGSFGTDANIALVLTMEQACEELSDEEFEVYLKQCEKVYKPASYSTETFPVVDGMIHVDSEANIDG